MAYTAADLASIDAAILALATGTRVVEATFQGRTVKYSTVDMEELRNLQSAIRAELAVSGGRPRHTVVSTSKGL